LQTGKLFFLYLARPSNAEAPTGLLYYLDPACKGCMFLYDAYSFRGDRPVMPNRSTFSRMASRRLMVSVAGTVKINRTRDFPMRGYDPLKGAGIYNHLFPAPLTGALPFDSQRLIWTRSEAGNGI
jgi:hypothetical protein